MSEITIKIDDKLKNEADKLFNDLGLDFNTAINAWILILLSIYFW